MNSVVVIPSYLGKNLVPLPDLQLPKQMPRNNTMGLDEIEIHVCLGNDIDS